MFHPLPRSLLNCSGLLEPIGDSLPWGMVRDEATIQRVFEKSGIAFRLSMEFPQLRMMPNSFYATDLTNSAWALISPLLPEAQQGGRPRPTDVRAVSDAIFYLLRTGCQWRLLPREFPVWGTVDHYFRSWKNAGVSGHCLYHRTCALSGVIRNQAMLRKR